MLRLLTLALIAAMLATGAADAKTLRWANRGDPQTAEPTSQLRVYANAAGAPKKIDDLTLEFTTNGPNPVELEHMNTINIMSKAWCEKYKATKPQNFTAKEDAYTAHNANGTGAYMLK